MFAGHAGSHIYKGISVYGVCVCVVVPLYVCILYVCVCFCVWREAISRLCERTSAKTALKNKRVRYKPSQTHTHTHTNAINTAITSITVNFVIISLHAKDRLLLSVGSTCSFLAAGSSSPSPQRAWLWSLPPPYRLQLQHLLPNYNWHTSEMLRQNKSSFSSLSFFSLSSSSENCPSPHAVHFVCLRRRPSMFIFLCYTCTSVFMGR